LFASLLSIPTGDGYEAISLSPERKKQKILEAVLTLLLHQAEQQPVLFVIEDLHWIDPSTLELIDLIIEQEPTNRILVLLTFRPEFIPPWGVHPHLQPISLKPLGQKQTGAIVEHMAGGKKLPEEVVEQIVQKTDGVPLFVEELTKMVLESGLVREGVDRYELAGPLPPLAIPTTLHDSLIARLDKLAEVKEVAQLGSTLGREFPFVLIRAVSQLEETVLQSHLGKLVSAGLLYQRGVPPQSVYQFKHALIRDAAYESLLKSKRQRYHQQIAQVLLEKFDDVAGAQPELVAQHYTAAGLNERAVPHWQRAGEKAIERSANVEAISHLRKGLTLLKPLPETQQRTEQELDLLTALGTALMAVKGFGAQEVKQTLDRARELCGQVGETPKLFEVLHGLWIFYLTKAELKTSQEIAEQLLSLAQRFQDPASLLEAHHVLGANFFWRGKYTHAQTHLEQAITLYDSQPQSSRVLLSGREDPGLTCRSVAAQGLWLLGYPDKALKKIEMAFTQAQKLSHTFSTAYALLSAVLVHLMRGESQQAQEKAEETITLSEEQGFALWLSWTIALRGSALAKKERGEEGIAQLCQGLEACQAIGSILNQIHLRILLAEAYGKTGKIEEGLTELDKARTLVEKNEGSFYDAELYRTMGELLLVQPTPDEKSAENEFRKAIDVAQRQQSKSLELRAAVSLSRLLQKQRKGEEARKLLSEVYGWFSEGFDTVDLIEAEELLQELL
jgi:predicted ATPase